MNMIAQILCSFLDSFEKAFAPGTEVDFGARMEQVASASNDMLKELVALMLQQADDAIAADPQRLEHFRVIRKDERKLLTCFGEVKFNRRYFQHKQTGERSYLLDMVMGIQAHAKVNGDVRQRAVSAAEQHSFRQSAEIASVEPLSKMSVCNYISELNNFPQLEAEGERRRIDNLYVEADEDHVALQDGRVAQKRLVTIHEGIREEGTRRMLVNPRFVTSPVGMPADALWQAVSGFIDKQYVSEEIRAVFLSGDGASWIRKGEDWLYPCVPILDGFHAMQALRKMCADQPQSIDAFLHHVKTGQREQAEALCKDVLSASAADRRKARATAASYLMNNWHRLCNRHHEGAVGCSAEGHVSHILSARLSTRPGAWSIDNLDRMAQLRVMSANGQMISYSQLRKGTEAASQETKNKAKDLISTKRFQTALRKNTKKGIQAAHASLPVLTHGKTTTLYQALHGLSAFTVA